ncbi:MAG: hypothetical protein AAB426_05985 [Myxococcota bacterium]
MSFSPQLPGADLVRQGLDDLAARRLSQEALLVAIGAPRLRRLMSEPALDGDRPVEPELALYREICRQSPDDAHSRYNALIRRLVSFEHALELEAASARRRGLR